MLRYLILKDTVEHQEHESMPNKESLQELANSDLRVTNTVSIGTIIQRRGLVIGALGSGAKIRVDNGH